MKRAMINLWAAFRAAWLRKPTMRRLIYASAPVLLLGLTLGGWQYMMLTTGYVQLVFRALNPGELVEIRPRQRTMALLGGMTRMLFFTGMMTHAAWPFALMAAAQALNLYILQRGERTGMELSLLPVLSGAGFAALGLLLGVRTPETQQLLLGAVALTFARLLIRQKQTMRQLVMRFHMA